MSKKGVTPGSVKTVSDNEQGNIYHDENGLMTSPDNGISSDIEEINDDFDWSDEGEFAGFDFDSILNDEGDFAGLDFNLDDEPTGHIGGLSDDEVLHKIEEIKAILNNDDLISNISSLSLEDKINDLSAIYDENLLKKASEQEIELLSLINALKVQKNEILQEQTSLEKFEFKGIWKYQTVTAKDYIEKKDTIELKRKFYEEQLSIINPEDISSKNWLNEKLEQLNLFEELGKKYEVLRDKYASLVTFNTDEYEEFSNSFLDKKSPYSQFRKDNAIWFNTGSVSQNVDLSLKEFGPKFELMWKSMTSKEQKALYDYTGAYSKYNEPLRLIGYSGGKSFSSSVGGDFIHAVQNMTSAIDKCTWDNDIWIQRGINLSTEFIKGIKQTTPGLSIEYMSDEELEALVGTIFEDQGFASGGAGKGTGFDRPIILNIYCPKGTKMAYMNTVGQYANGHENEMVLQRGYSYRITKIEKKGTEYSKRFYIDCEVILGSDENKWTEEELLAIQNKNY